MALTNEDLQAIASLIDDKLDKKLDEKLQPISNRLDKIESDMSGVNNRLDRLESDISGLKASQIEIRKEVKAVHDKVTDTYELALDAWGKSTENRTWLEKIDA